MNRFRWLSTAVLAMLLSSSALASKCSVGADVSFAPNSVAVDAESLEKLLEPIRRVQKENTVLAYVAAGYTDKSEAIVTMRRSIVFILLASSCALAQADEASKSELAGRLAKVLDFEGTGGPDDRGRARGLHQVFSVGSWREFS
jgi:hypothetical protein